MGVVQTLVRALHRLFSLNSRRGSFVIWMCTFVFLECCWSFNIDVTRPLIFHGINNTNFGASVELLNNTKGKWVLVGAPLDTKESFANFETTGNVYMCPIHIQKNTSDVTNCSEINVTESISVVSNDSRFGASVMVLEETTVICAPSYKNPLKSNATSGACVYFKNEDPSTISKLLIRITEPDSYSFSWSMYGFSTTAGMNSTFPYTIGGPNSGSQAGGLATFGATRRGLVSRRVKGTESIQPGAYFGYSLDGGTFDGNKYYYVAGRPGFANKNGNIGNVEILEFFEDEKKTTKKLIEGFQLGGGFGHTVCVADINGDGNDDVLIGAPLEYVNQTNKNLIVDSGAVYIYIGTGSTDIIEETPFSIRGMEKPMARFGTAIANLGDISNDGITDIAIGAPFENNHRGAVYIYNGNRGYLPKHWTFSQRISSTDIGMGISALGFSISRSHVDIDDNLYGDLAVSGFKSDQVVVLRTRPVANVTVDVLTTPGFIPINSTGLDCNDGSDFPCVTLNVRFLVSGKGLQNGVYLNYSLYSDVFSEGERFLLRPNDSLTNNLEPSVESQIIKLMPDEITFVNVSVTLRTVDWRFFNSLEDPVTLKLTFTLADFTDREEVPPMLHNDVITTHSKTLEINRNCSFNPCKPNHVAKLSSADSNMTLQQNQELSVQMTLTNTGDPVETTEFYVETFPKMDFSRITEGFNDLQCAMVSLGIMYCELRPVTFYAHQSYYFVLNFFIDPDAVVDRNSDHVKIEVLFNSTSNKDNKFVMINHFNLQSYVRVVGGSSFSELILASNTGTINKYSVSFDIHNDGPSPLGANFKIAVPTNKGNSDLIVKGLTVGKGSCSAQDVEINMLGEPENIQSQSLKDEEEEEREKGPTEIRCGLSGFSCTYLTCDLGYITATDYESVEFTMDIQSDVLSSIFKTLGAEKGLFVTIGEVLLFDNNIPAFINVTRKGEVALRVSVGTAGLDSKDILWYSIGGSAGGLLIFIIIALILWKCGFFNRKRRGEIDRAKRQSMMKQKQSNMMSSFVNKELHRRPESSLNGDDKSQIFRQSAKKDYPDLEIQDR